MKKKILAIMITTLMLTGCGNNNVNNSNELSSNNKTNHSSDLIFIKYGYNEYNNGCVYGENPAKYLDFSTLESAPLCAVPNCTHKDSSCLARQIGNTPVFYNGFIYFFESNYGECRETPDGCEFFIDSYLKKASLNSSEIETVCEFHDVSPFEGYMGLVLNGNELFFVSDDQNPIKDDYGNYSWTNVGGTHYLTSINLDTGKFTNHGSIYDGDKEYKGAEYSSSANIVGIYDDKMYINYTFIKDNDELQNIETADDLDKLWTRVNVEYDFESETLKESELAFSLYANTVTYTHYDYDKGTLNVNYKGTGKEISCDNPQFALKECNGKLFFTEEGTFYDLNTMTKYKLGEYSNYNIMGYSDGNYIFSSARKAIKLTEEELLALDKE